MIDITKYTKQELKVYEKIGIDEYGKPILGVSMVIPCRFSNKKINRTDSNGNKYEIDASAYISTIYDLSVGKITEYKNTMYKVFDVYTPVTIGGAENHKKIMLKSWVSK